MEKQKKDQVISIKVPTQSFKFFTIYILFPSNKMNKRGNFIQAYLMPFIFSTKKKKIRLLLKIHSQRTNYTSEMNEFGISPLGGGHCF